MLADSELLRRYSEDSSEEAFAELVGRHIDFVYSTALRRTRNAQRAEDMTQVVFIELAKQAPALARRTELVGWLYTSARYIGAKIARTEARRQRREQEAQMMKEHEVDPSSKIDWDRLDPLLDDALGELNELDRSAILLRFFKNQTFADLGIALDLGEEAARKRVSRAVDKLRDRLARRGITSTAGALATTLGSQAGFAAPTGLRTTVTQAAMTASPPIATSNVIKLMTTSKTAAGLAVLAGIFAVGLAFRETAILQKATTSLAAAKQECENLAGRLQQLRQSTQAMETEQASLKSDAAIAASGRGAPGRERTGAANDKTAAADQRAKMAALRKQINQDPKVHDLVAKLVAWNNTEFFGPLFKSAGLSDAQVQRAEYLMGQLEAFSGLGPTPLSYQTDPRSRAEIQNELVQVIGDDGAVALSTYDIVRHATDVVAGYLYSSENPLTTEQASQLTEIMVSTNQQKNAPQGNWYSVQATDWSAALTQAQAILTPQQLAVFKDFAMSRGANLK